MKKFYDTPIPLRNIVEQYIDKMIDDKLCNILLELKEEIKKDIMEKLDKGILW